MGRVDTESLSRLEELFQREMHVKLYSIRFEDQMTTMELHGLIKGAHAFLQWVIDRKRRMDQ